MTWRAALRVALWSMLLATLGACSSLPFMSKGKSAAAAAAAAPAPPQFELQVDAPSALRDLLLQHLDLARLQHAPEADSLTSSELDRLVAAAGAQARSLLETAGYFNPEVKVTRETRVGKLPLLRIGVQPGPITRVEKLTLEVQGPLQVQADAGDADAVDLLGDVQSEWALQPGQPFRNAAWESAKNRVLASLRSAGYLAASWSGTLARVDADYNKATLYLVADSGPRFYLGTAVVSGLQRYDSGTVLPVVAAWAGQPASEQVLREVQERLLGIGLFESAVVSVEADVEHASAAPLLVAVRELNKQTATVGIGFSDSVGPQLTLEHTHRRIFGTRWVATNKFQLGTKQNYWQGDLISHPQPDGYRNLFAGQAERLEADDEIRQSWHVRAGRTIDGIRILRLYYAEYAAARLDTVAGVNDSSALSANYHWTWRNVDNQRAPTQGVALALQGALGYTHGEVTSADKLTQAEGSGPFGRAYGRLSGFWPFHETWYGSARLELGQVFVNEALSVPDTLLFRAGGDQSVRGYAFRSLGPEVNGATVSGSKLFTASLQVEHPIWASQPDFLWAVFVDAGNAANSWRDLRPVLGYGVGLHWRSPVGPLRIDLAYGQEVQRFRLSFSVGVTF